MTSDIMQKAKHMARRDNDFGHLFHAAAERLLAIGDKKAALAAFEKSSDFFRGAKYCIEYAERRDRLDALGVPC
jgi:hypothetical protein